MPFNDGMEVYCFRGKIRNPKTHEVEDKVFKLSKYKELNIEDNFWTQTIARFLAKEYGMVFLVSKIFPSIIGKLIIFFFFFNNF